MFSRRNFLVDKGFSSVDLNKISRDSNSDLQTYTDEQKYLELKALSNAGRVF